MKLKSVMIATTAAVTFGFGASSHAQSFGECAAVELVQFSGTVVDAALATPELSTLVDVVVAAGLADTLANAEDITVYAPTNDAFAAVPAGILDAVVSDVDLLTTVLTYHVSPGKRDPRVWIEGRRANTLAGPRVFFQRQDGRARVNNAAVECQGVQTDNGTVWIINSVLLP